MKITLRDGTEYYGDGSDWWSFIPSGHNNGESEQSYIIEGDNLIDALVAEVRRLWEVIEGFNNALTDGCIYPSERAARLARKKLDAHVTIEEDTK